MRFILFGSYYRKWYNKLCKVFVSPLSGLCFQRWACYQLLSGMDDFGLWLRRPILYGNNQCRNGPFFQCGHLVIKIKNFEIFLYIIMTSSSLLILRLKRPPTWHVFYYQSVLKARIYLLMQNLESPIEPKSSTAQCDHCICTFE